MIINKEGRLFGKINLIDAIIVVSILFLIPMLFFGYKLLTKPASIEIITTYIVSDICPICKKSISVEIEKGKPVSANYKTICLNCSNEVILFKPKPIPKPKLSYQEQYYRCLLETIK